MQLHNVYCLFFSKSICIMERKKMPLPYSLCMDGRTKLFISVVDHIWWPTVRVLNVPSVRLEQLYCNSCSKWPLKWSTSTSMRKWNTLKCENQLTCRLLHLWLAPGLLAYGFCYLNNKWWDTYCMEGEILWVLSVIGKNRFICSVPHIQLFKNNIPTKVATHFIIFIIKYSYFKSSAFSCLSCLQWTVTLSSSQLD